MDGVPPAPTLARARSRNARQLARRLQRSPPASSPTNRPTSSIRRKVQEEAQLLQPEVGAGEMRAAVTRVGGLDQRLQHVERGRLDAVAEQEPLLAGELRNRRHQPVEELIVRLDGRTGAAGIVRHGTLLQKATGAGRPRWSALPLRYLSAGTQNRRRCGGPSAGRTQSSWTALDASVHAPCLREGMDSGDKAYWAEEENDPHESRCCCFGCRVYSCCGSPSAGFRGQVSGVRFQGSGFRGQVLGARRRAWRTLSILPTSVARWSAGRDSSSPIRPTSWANVSSVSVSASEPRAMLMKFA